MIRAFWRSVKVENATPPYDTIHLKVFYPAKMSGKEEGSNWGIVPANSEQAPFPIVIFLSGANCSLEMYQWLAVELAQRGLVVVGFNWVAENLPGSVSLTPGVDISAWNPATYGQKPTASALPTILAELKSLQSQGVLAGLLDLDKIIIGGHSAGGRVALENAEPRFFPQVAAAFAYGAHTGGATMLGFAPDTILPLPSSLPMLIIGGSCDGVIANSSKIYGVPTGNSTRFVVRTFQEAISSSRNDSYLVIMAGANHFAIAEPKDPFTTTDFLDFPSTQPENQIRSLLAETISLFINAHVRHQPEAAQTLVELLGNHHPLVELFEHK